MTKPVEVAVSKQSDLDRFVEKARVAAAVVTDVGSFQEAIDYTLNLCGSRGACRLKVSGCEEALSPNAEDLCETKQGKIIAAPQLSSAEFEMLERQCAENGFSCISSGMRLAACRSRYRFYLCGYRYCRDRNTRSQLPGRGTAPGHNGL